MYIFIMNAVHSHTVFLALGSNIDDRFSFLSLALDKLQQISTTKIESSRIFDTAPLGPTPQNRYLNMCVKMSTTLSPLFLLEYCKKTEMDLGRIHRVKWGSREIDIDILFYENVNMNIPSLTLPHPEIANRVFVLIPLSDIAPHLVLPGKQQTISEYVLNQITQEDLQSLSLYSERPHSKYAASQTH